MKGSSSRSSADDDRSPTELRRALSFVIAGYRRVLVATAGASFVGGLAEAVFLVTITRLAFAVSEGDEEVGIVAGRGLSVDATLVFAVVLIAVRVLLAVLAIWQTSRISSSVVAHLRQRLTRAFLRSSWEVQQDQQGGSLQQLVDGYTSQASATMSGVSSGVVAMANLVAMLGLAVAVDPLGSVVMLVSIVGFAIVLRPIRKLVRRRADESNSARMNLAVAVNETSQLGMELHVFHVQSEAVHRLDQHIDAARDKSRRLQFANSSMSTVYSALAYIALVLALAVVAQSNAADLKSIGAVMLVMLRSLSYGQALQVAYLGVIGSVPAIGEVADRLEEFESNKRIDGGEPVGAIGTVHVRNVSFAYPEGDHVLHDISFRIAPSEIIGIVGPSGGGKSTLVQLLRGFRDPDEGSIEADGRIISSFAKSEWARKVTFVPQTAHLIAGSIADNIRFMRDGVSNDEVVRAARLAQLHDDIKDFPDGYRRPVGERGSSLSGGQQQRLCIARALVERPDLLILDEPTSALDVKSEHLVRATLLELKERMSVIVIAHRLSTLDICDRIMVIQDGHLGGLDTPDRLRKSNEFYREALELSGLS